MHIDVRASRKLRESAAVVRARSGRLVSVGDESLWTSRTCAWSATGSSTRTTSVTRSMVRPLIARPAAARPNRRSTVTSSPSTCAAASQPGTTWRRRWRARSRAAANPTGIGSSRGCPARRAASGGSTRCTGRRSPSGRRPRAGTTSRRCPAGRATRATPTAARDTILGLFTIWDELAERRALPDQLHVLELGVGNGNQARIWLDEFTELDRGTAATTTVGCTT